MLLGCVIAVSVHILNQVQIFAHVSQTVQLYIACDLHFISGTKESQNTRLEGPIQRKHEWENTATKASHRTWDKLYAILHEHSVSFYKDQKHAKSVSIAFRKLGINSTGVCRPLDLKPTGVCRP